MILPETPKPRRFSLPDISLLNVPSQVNVSPANSGLIHNGGVECLISNADGPEVHKGRFPAGKSGLTPPRRSVSENAGRANMVQ